MTTTREQVLAVLTERDGELPDDGVTLEKIRDRGTHFRMVQGEFLSFRIERHPTMYLSGMGVPGIDASPARFHILTEYRLDVNCPAHGGAGPVSELGLYRP